MTENLGRPRRLEPHICTPGIRGRGTTDVRRGTYGWGEVCLEKVDVLSEFARAYRDRGVETLFWVGFVDFGTRRVTYCMNEISVWLSDWRDLVFLLYFRHK